VAESPLDSLLANERWLTHVRPFPYTVAANVFRAEVYAELDAAFAALLERGLDAGPAGFSRNVPGYDAFAHTLHPGDTGPLSLFTTRAWHDLLCGVAGVAGSGHVFCGLHHHSAGSGSGTVHNDLNPGWFPREAATTEVVLNDESACVFRTGEVRTPGIHPMRTVRGVAMIYFLHNGPWRPGAGGETGLYSSFSEPVDRPTVAVPPVDNSLVLFECTPHSLHAFLSNRRSPRNSLIMWVHRPEHDVVARWGAGVVVEWPGTAAPAGPTGRAPSRVAGGAERILMDHGSTHSGRASAGQVAAGRRPRRGEEISRDE
jgi:hypothetical protein